MRRCMAVVLAAALTGCMLAGCQTNRKENEPEEKNVLKAGLVVDQAQISVDPFQYSTWKGLENFKADREEIEIEYRESETEDEYLPNFDRLADEGCRLIAGSGFLLADAAKEAAKINKDVNYVLLDYTFAETEMLDNLTGIDFASEISAFLVGYIAGNATETGKVGFVGGISSVPLDRFEYGYRYGVAYAAKELDKKIEVRTDYTDTFTEQVAGKNAAVKMYDEECDIIFQAAGESGLGVIEAAKFADKWVIGVDVDQYEEAPDNVLTSALKYVDKAVEEVLTEYEENQDIGGKNYMYGLEEHAVGIPRKNPNLEKNYPGLYEKTMELEQEIQSGAITVPYDKSSFEEMLEKL